MGLILKGGTIVTAEKIYKSDIKIVKEVIAEIGKNTL